MWQLFIYAFGIYAGFNVAWLGLDLYKKWISRRGQFVVAWRDNAAQMGITFFGIVGGFFLSVAGLEAIVEAFL